MPVAGWCAGGARFGTAARAPQALEAAATTTAGPHNATAGAGRLAATTVHHRPLTVPGVATPTTSRVAVGAAVGAWQVVADVGRRVVTAGGAVALAAVRLAVVAAALAAAAAAPSGAFCVLCVL